MKIASKLAILTVLAMLFIPQLSSVAYADDEDDSCVSEEQDDDDCKREKPKFQTKFFSG